MTISGHQRVVLDADADVVEARIDVFSWPDVTTRLEGQHHAGPQRTPLTRKLVVAGVVHVEAQPVPGAVHVEAAVGLALQHAIE